MSDQKVVPFTSQLATAIIVTIFCCWPFGIPAIVFAARANAALKNGDAERALALNKSAKIWIWVSFGLGLAFALIYTLFNVLAVGAFR